MEENIVRITCNEMRAQARASLSGKWTTAVLAILVFYLIIFIPSILMIISESMGTIMMVAFTIFIQGPLFAGLYKLSLNIAEHKEIEIGNIFEGFNHFGKMVIVTILMVIFTVLWSLLFYIPGIIAGLRYSQAYFILLENPEIGPMEAIRRSKEMMKGNKGKLFLLYLSFIGWAILAIIPLGVGLLWLYPYMYVTLAVFYLELKQKTQVE